MSRVARIFGLGCIGLLCSVGTGNAQRWWDEGFAAPRGNTQRVQPYWDYSPYSRYAPFPYGAPRTALPNEVRDGGARPVIAPVAPPIVPFAYEYPANSIVIDSGAKQLYYVLPDKKAYAYQIAVGREGFDWTGTEVISRKQEWPDWHPPAEMRERDASLPAKMMGGLKNPLGAMALYLGTTLYRIHGTNDERSLGQAGSSGCFRMMNASVLHLASLADVGTTVNVVASLEPPRRVSDAGQARQAPPPRVQRPAPPPRWAPDPWWQGGRDYRSWREDPYWRWR